MAPSGTPFLSVLEVDVIFPYESEYICRLCACLCLEFCLKGRSGKLCGRLYQL